MNTSKLPVKRDNCGTSAGYQKHWYYKESQCDPCRLAMNKQNRGLKTTARKSVRYRRNEKVRAHGLTLERYTELLESQGGVCGICKLEEVTKNPNTGFPRSLSIDHDHNCCPGNHSCGKCVRGLLCHKCHSALGIIEFVGSVEPFEAYLSAYKMV